MDPYRSADFLPAGTVLEGWGGTVARDHNHLGLFVDGPQPARGPLVRLIGVQTSEESPLPPQLARILSFAEKVRMNVQRVRLRQAIPRIVPVHREASEVKRRLAPLVLGRKRLGVAR
jgi:hypothetical protein